MTNLNQVQGKYEFNKQDLASVECMALSSVWEAAAPNLILSN